MKMSVGFIYRRLAVLLSVCLAILCLSLQTSGYGQQKQSSEEDSKDEPRDSAPRYSGVAYCSGCHEEPRGEFRRQVDWCRLTEYKIWKNEDKHARAYNVLLSPEKFKEATQKLEDAGFTKEEIARETNALHSAQLRTVEMEKQLGWEPGRAAKDPACLNCHAMIPKGTTDATLSKRVAKRFKKEDGVSCDGCHGPSSKWGDLHTDRTEWWALNPLQKEKLGFRDVRDPVKRAAMCLSCHVGATEDGEAGKKMVTHEMYAAGHPPLPSIDVAFFSEHEPKHWRDLGEKDPKIQKRFKASKTGKAFKYDAELMEQTRHVVVGGMVALRQSLALLAGEGTGPAAEALDLAHFDCYGCHQDLRSTSWRQKRRLISGVRPGRPTGRTWPTVLAKLAMVALGKNPNDLDKELHPVLVAMSSKPFGDKNEVVNAAKKAVAWCDEQTKALEKVDFNKVLASRLLKELPKLAEADVPDYDSARQIAWAYVMMAKEIQGKDVTGKFKDVIRLEIPSGQTKSILGELPVSLEKLSTYDPDQFRKAMQDLAKDS